MIISKIKTFAIAAILLGVAFLVIFASLAMSPNYNHCVGHSGEHATGEHGEKGSPIIEPSIEHPSPINLFVYCGGIYANENGAGVTALATVLLTIATGLLGYLAWDQGRTTRVQLRAFVSPGPMSCFRFDPTGGNQHGFDIQLFNSGASPAYRIRFSGKMKALPVIDDTTNLLETYPIEFTDGAGNGVAFIVPHSFSTGLVKLEPPLTPKELNAITSDKNKKLYVWGRAEYFDVFKAKHFFTFAFSIRTSLDFEKAGGAEFIPNVVFADQCVLGNAAD